MRIVTRPDFDGIVCAVLLSDALNIKKPVKWAEPYTMQHGMVDVQPGDIIANLSYHDQCTLWFDHHESNRIDGPFNGIFKIAPSAAGIIYDYYKNEKNGFKRDYSRLVKETDKIDSAALSLDEVLHPENYPYAALSLTITGHNRSDESYWNHLVRLLQKSEINQILEDPEVSRRVKSAIETNKIYTELLEKYTRNLHHVTVTDFRFLSKMPFGSRFLVFSLFPESVVNVKIGFDPAHRGLTVISVGHSIFNRNCHVSAGQLCARFDGGGHRGAGSCRVPANIANQTLETIVDILLANQPLPFNILYEEPFFIAVDKPPDLLSIETGKERFDSLRLGVSQYLEKHSDAEIDLQVVYSLDREASGIVLFAKNIKIRDSLRENREKTKKVYSALVEGHPPGISGSFDHSNRYWQLGKYGRYSLLEIEPEVESEFEHQVRAHLSRIGCPVVGDKKYGASENPLNRLGLHAGFIAFTHPVSKKRIVLESPTPKIFLAQGVKNEKNRKQ